MRFYRAKISETWISSHGLLAGARGAHAGSWEIRGLLGSRAEATGTQDYPDSLIRKEQARRAHSDGAGSAASTRTRSS